MLFSMLGCTALFAHPRIMSIIIIAGLGCSLVLDCELVNGLLCYAAVPHSLCVYNSYRKDQKSCQKVYLQLLFWGGQLRSFFEGNDRIRRIRNRDFKLMAAQTGTNFQFFILLWLQKMNIRSCSTFFRIKVRHFNSVSFLFDILRYIHFWNSVFFSLWKQVPSAHVSRG